jgi:hypothetical protein
MGEKERLKRGAADCEASREDKEREESYLRLLRT